MFLSRIQGRRLGRLSGRDRSRRRHRCAAASGIEGEYRSIAEICLSRKARPDARKKEEAIAPSFVFEVCVRIWLFPTRPVRLREDVDNRFVPVRVI